MSKLPNHLEDPIDVHIYRFCELTVPIFKCLNFSPNMITTLGLVANYFCIKFIHEDKYIEAAAMYALYYYFDCLDGTMARKYKMFSKFGELYDHATDIIFGITIIGVLLKKCVDRRILLAYVIGLYVTLTGVHTGCMERYLDNSDTLKKSKMLCPDVKYLKYTRFFGHGVFAVVTIVVIYNLPKLCRLNLQK
jgi:phosphatidylglycerophosphate synthase